MKDDKILKSALIKQFKDKENDDENEKRLDFSNNSSVFTEETHKLSTFQYLLSSLGNFFVKLGLFIWGWLVTIVKAFINIFVSIYKILRYGFILVYKFFKDLIHKFKYNDWAGRLSYIIFGAGSFKHGQIVNGVLYIVFEIGYLIFFILTGAETLSGIWDLGHNTVDPSWIYTSTSANPILITVNSLTRLIYGLFVLISLFLFIYIWYRSIISGYNNYRISKFNEYKYIYESNMDLSNSIDEIIKNKYLKSNEDKLNEFKVLLYNNEDDQLNINESYNKYIKSLSNTKISKKSIKDETLNNLNELIESLSKNEDDEKLLKFYKDYTNYLCKYSINESYKYYKDLQKDYIKKTKIEIEYNYICETHLISNESITDENALNDVLLKQKKKEHKYLDKLTAINKSISEKEKVHSSFVARLSRINYNSYSKYNEYFVKMSRYELDLKFYKNYLDINNYFHNIGGDFDKANQSNVVLKEETTAEFKAKYDAIVARYDEIFTKKDNILKSIKEQQILLKEELKKLDIAYKEKINSLNNDKDAILSIKEEYKINKDTLINEFTTRINKLDGQYNSFPSDKLLNTLKKEELKLVSKRNKDDIKYIKTNYTSDTYAKEETINYMMLTYDFDYNYAKKHFNEITLDLNSEFIDEKIRSLSSDEATYEEINGSTKFVGKSKSFKEQIKSLFNEKFHITILALPIIGATIVCIIPLLFSILIAFTNYDRYHMVNVVPFAWTGFETFIKMFSGTDPIYGQIGSTIGVTFTWTLVWAIFATFSNYFLGIIVALMINKDGIKLKKLWRTIFVLTIAIPQFISLGTMAKMLNSTGTGVLDNLLRAINGSTQSVLKFASGIENNALTTKIIIIIVNIWVGIPYTILSTTGILMNIPKDLYESSRIDGAGPATQFFKITMPYILFVTGPSLITSFIGNFNNFGVIYFLTGGAPARNAQGSSIAPGYTDLFITYIYTLVTDTNRQYYNVASALGIIIFIICSFISIILYNKTGAVSKEDQFQ